MNPPPAEAGGIGYQLKWRLRMKSPYSLADWQGSVFVFDFEIAIIMALLLNIGFNYFVSHIALLQQKYPLAHRWHPNIDDGEIQNCGAIYTSFCPSTSAPND